VEDAMTHRKNGHHREGSEHVRTISPEALARARQEEARKKLDVVLKCDTFGSAEAVSAAIMKIDVPGILLRIIHSGVGDVSKSDLLMALTGSRLVLGFNVGVMSKGEQWVKEHGGEVRLYNVIFRLLEDLKQIAQSLMTVRAEERVTARATVIALFKGSHRGSIVGCEVREGLLSTGKHFRIISAMGPIYSGKIESLQIDRRPTREAKAGQQVGIKIEDFDKARVGDLVECYETVREGRSAPWKAGGSILHLEQAS
jgi:translation initiation factor IF-2